MSTSVKEESKKEIKDTNKPKNRNDIYNKCYICDTPFDIDLFWEQEDCVSISCKFCQHGYFNSEELIYCIKCEKKTFSECDNSCGTAYCDECNTDYYVVFFKKDNCLQYIIKPGHHPNCW